MNTPLIWYSDYLFRACLPIWIRIMRSHSKVAIFEQSNNVFSSRSTTTGGLSKIDAHFVELVELQGILEHMWIGHYSYWNSTLQGTQHMKFRAKHNQRKMFLIQKSSYNLSSIKIKSAKPLKMKFHWVTLQVLVVFWYARRIVIFVCI